MRFRSGRAVASGLGLAVVVTSVAVAAAPPGTSSRQARRAGPRLDDPTRLTVPRAGLAAPVTSSTVRARARLRGSLGRYAQVTVDDQTGGLKAVGKLDGYLTGASTAGAGSVALGYVRDHAAAFGLSSSDLDALELVRDYTSADGVRHLQWAQAADGITVVDSSLMANVTREGRLINVLGGARGGLTLNRRSPVVSADGAYTACIALGRIEPRRAAAAIGALDRLAQDDVRRQRPGRARGLPRRRRLAARLARDRAGRPGRRLRHARRRRRRPDRAAREPGQVRRRARGRELARGPPGRHAGAAADRPVARPGRDAVARQQRLRVQGRARRGRRHADPGRVPRHLHPAGGRRRAALERRRLALSHHPGREPHR